MVSWLAGFLGILMGVLFAPIVASIKGTGSTAATLIIPLLIGLVLQFGWYVVWRILIQRSIDLGNPKYKTGAAVTLAIVFSVIHVFLTYAIGFQWSLSYILGLKLLVILSLIWEMVLISVIPYIVFVPRR